MSSNRQWRDRRIWLSILFITLACEAAFLYAQLVLWPSYGKRPYEGWDLLEVVVSTPIVGAMMFTGALAQRSRALQLVGVVSLTWLLAFGWSAGIPAYESPILEFALHSDFGAAIALLGSTSTAVIGYGFMAADRGAVQARRQRYQKVRHRIEQFPSTLVLKPRLLPRMLPVALFTLVMLLSIYGIWSGNAFGWLVAVVVGPFLVISVRIPLRDYLSEDKDRLVLSQEGFVEHYLGNERVYRWEEARSFRVVAGDSGGLTHVVAFDVASGNDVKGHRSLLGLSTSKNPAMLRDNYGMKTEELVLTMEDFHRGALRASKKQKNLIPLGSL